MRGANARARRPRMPLHYVLCVLLVYCACFVCVCVWGGATQTFPLLRAGQGTWFDNTGLVRPDIGAGPGNSPYRMRPLVWTFNGTSYLNERTVGVQVGSACPPPLCMGLPLAAVLGTRACVYRSVRWWLGVRLQVGHRVHGEL